MERTFHLQAIICEAYGIENNQIAGAPDWLNSDKYDLETKIGGSVADEFSKLSEDQRMAAKQRLLQALLAERFKLEVYRETKELPVYVLTVAKTGSKLQDPKPGDTYANGIKGFDGLPIGPHKIMVKMEGDMTAQALPVSVLVKFLTPKWSRTILDQIGLAGEYDFALRFPENQQGDSNSYSFDSAAAALQEQLGLELFSHTAPVSVLVVDHAEPVTAHIVDVSRM